MQLTIDNLDGLGPVDYTASIDASEPFEILRTLNAPSTVKGVLCLAGQASGGAALTTPVRRARVAIQSSAGIVLFTGYLATEPVAVYAGAASQGPVYRLALSAVSDEWLLDKQSSGSAVGAAFNAGGGTLVTSFAQRLSAGTLSTSSLPAGRLLGVFEPSSSARWSDHAGAIAGSSYSAYRALSGSLGLTSIPSVQHTFSDGDGSLQVFALKTASVRELANDLTVSGAQEPSAYWTELFAGDGTTSVFNLLGEPDAPNAGHASQIAELFNEPFLDSQIWQISDPGSHLSLSGAGFTFTGGNGLDGQTTLTAWNQLELGGTLVFELAGVSLAAGSAGVIAGLYNGSILQANCFAGFNVRQSGGTTLITPLVNGIETGTSYTMVAGRLYTLRIHLHSPEMLRIRQSFYALDDTASGVAVTEFGGGLMNSPVSLVFEIRDLASSSNTPVTVLYDGTSASSPAQVNVVPVNSLELAGSIGALHLTRTGSCWVRSTPSSGAAFTRLAGASTDGVDCSVTSSSAGKVTFFNGRIPAAGETIAVFYRGRQRSVARVADPVSLAAEAAGEAAGSVGTARWLGRVTQPPARSSEDCENAAQAILSFAANRSAALSGSYTSVNPPGGDIWPGDVIVLNISGSTLNAIVRKVELSEQNASPAALTYRIAFANDWAEGLGIKLSEAVAADALLPEVALLLTTGPSPAIPAHVLVNLPQMTVVNSGSDSLTVDAGLAPPAGGGFEVRRRDGGFGVGIASSASGDLVLRTPVRGFSIPLSTFPETFFVRMYDASSPPLYSRFSTAIVSQMPLT